MSLDYPYHTFDDLAHEDGTTREAVRAKLRRCGLTALKAADRTPIERSMHMTDAEAVVYLRDALALAYEALGVVTRWDGMTGTQSRILSALKHATDNGGLKSLEALEAVVRSDPARSATGRTINCHLSDIRRRLEETGQPWRIVNVWGLGWKLERIEDANT